MVRLIVTCLLFLLATAPIGPGAHATTAASDWAGDDNVQVRLISGVSAVGKDGALPIGLQFRLAEGWKVYWRSAGDAGFPPSIVWDGSRNFGAANWSWPLPIRFSLFGFETFGYKDEAVYPIEITPERSGNGVDLWAKTNALVCSDICIPLEADLQLTLPAGEPRPTAFTQLLSRYRAQVPGPPRGTGLDLASFGAIGEPAPHSLSVRLTSSRPLVAPDVFVEAAKGFSFGKPVVQFSADRLTADLTIPATVPKGKALRGQEMVLTTVDGERFMQIAATVTNSQLPAFAAQEDGNIWAAVIGMLGVAFLGGLILNLMPCVLPVLSLKLLGVVKYGGAAPGAIRRGFLASAAGIVFSFLVLAAAAIGLQMAGVGVGWGIQFQHPAFLVAMTLLVMGFAANLWGLFEIPLPRLIADRLVPSSGSKPAENSLVGHFATGAFATLLATPCSAPFVGTAVAFAFSRGPVEILAIFAVMGLGLATPYLLVAFVPRLAQMLPRPGRWMIVLRRVLGLALLATAIWLLSIIAVQAGTKSAGIIGGLLLAGLVVLWISRPDGEGRKRLGTVVTSSLLAGIALLALGIGVEANVNRREAPEVTRTADASPEAEVTWVTFDTQEIARLVAEGHTVLVDVTADWCITCKINKSLVLLRGPVGAHLATGRVIAMRADWTLPNPDIADYLASFGRYGIPFNAVYGPKAPTGIALPELLSDDTVLAAIATVSDDPKLASVTLDRPALVSADYRTFR